MKAAVALFVVAALAACCETPAPEPRASMDPMQPATPAPLPVPPATSPAATAQVATAPPAFAVPPRPDEPSSPARACKTDDDCALVPDDCTTCPPCEATWRKAANKATVQKMLASRPECPPISCEQCAPLPTRPGEPKQLTGNIGDRAACERGQCVAVMAPAPP